jgi:hypothetical protein
MYSSDGRDRPDQLQLRVSEYEKPKFRHFEPENGDFDKSYLHQDHVRKRGDTMQGRAWHVLFGGAHVLRGAAWSSLVNTNAL